MTPDLEATLKNLPDRPGVYLMKDDRGAGRLRRQGPEPAQPRPQLLAEGGARPLEGHRIRAVIDRIADVEYTITDSVSEALLLEANLIKRYRPRFNVRLKDDKSYPYIKITLADDFPRIERTRKLVQDGSRYFGPYASASSVDESMNLIRRLFPFRTCTIDIHDGERALQRPCLLYHIKRCQGPCIEAIDEGRVPGQTSTRSSSSSRAARRRSSERSSGEMTGGRRADSNYERAAALRDKVRAIERTMESQKMAAFARTELDLVGLARQDNEAGGPAVRHPRTARWSAATCSCSTRRPTRPTRRCCAASSSSTTRARRRSRREILRAVRAARRRRPRGVPRRAPRRAGPLARAASAARSAS